MNSSKTLGRGLGALLLATSLTLGSTAVAAAQGIEPIRPVHQQAAELIGANGTLLEIAYAENAQEAEAIFFAGQRDQLARAATDPNGRPFGKFLTSDLTGEPTFVVLDLGWLVTAEPGDFVNLEEQEAIRIDMEQQADGTFLARSYAELAKGSMVNNTDWGVQEAFTTQDDSINARALHNGPDDDEARAQRENRRDD